MNMISNFRNGALWKSPGLRMALLQYLSEGKYCLLAIEETYRPQRGLLFNVVTDPDGSGKWMYLAEELPARLRNWTPIIDYPFLKFQEKIEYPIRS